MPAWHKRGVYWQVPYIEESFPELQPSQLGWCVFVPLESDETRKWPCL